MKYGEVLEIEEVDDYVHSAADFKQVDLPDDCSLVEDLDDNHKVKQYAIERGLLGKFP